MDMIEIEAAIYRAALTAGQSMGRDILKLSCFYSNWSAQVGTARRRARLS